MGRALLRDRGDVVTKRRSAAAADVTVQSLFTSMSSLMREGHAKAPCW
jgi:hypothetical protein